MTKQERVDSFLRLIGFLYLEVDKLAIRNYLKTKLKEKSTIDTSKLNMEELLSNYFNCIGLGLESPDYVELRDFVINLLYLSKESRL